MESSPNHDESRLLASARSGDEAAFGALCARYEARMRRRVERRLSPAVRRRVAASDVIQEALLVASRRLRDFEDRGPGSFGSWLARIVDLKAQHLVRHHAGIAKRDVAAEAPRAQRGRIAHVRGPGPSPSQAAMGREATDAARHAMTRLPEAYHQVILLIQGEGLTLAEAADRMGRTRDSVKGLYSRALGRLAREMELDGGAS